MACLLYVQIQFMPVDPRNALALLPSAQSLLRQSDNVPLAPK
jgi:hypothetical protein